MFTLQHLSGLCRRFRYYRTVTFAKRSIRLANKSPIISFTFDDFPKSALQNGGKILEEFGLSGTYYTSIGLMNADAPVGRIFSENDLQELLHRGHELGCHTYNHCHAWNTSPKVFERSMIKNAQELNRIIPGATFSSFSYPISIPHPQNKKKAGMHFECCRGGGYQPLNSHMSDLNFLNAFFLEKAGGDQKKIKELIDRNCKIGGWLIFATHDISTDPTQFGCTPAFYLEAVRYAVASGAAILPVSLALRRIKAEVTG